MSEHDSRDLIGTEWDDLPYAHERDDGLGWYYRDEPHGGFLLVAETEAFFHTDDGEEVTVRVGIGVEFIDWEAAVGEEGYVAQAQGIVHPECLTEDSLSDVACSGVDPDDVDYFDVSRYGYNVPIDDVHSSEGWEEAYDQLLSQVAFADTAIGFVLDRPINRLGTTGWDLIRDAANDVDAYEAARERAKKHHGIE